MPTPSWKPPDASQIGVTLETFILEGMFEFPDARGTFTSLLNQICLAAKIITGRVRRAGLADVFGYTGETNVQGELVQKLDMIAHEALVQSLRRRGHCAALATEEAPDPILFEGATGNYLVVSDPLDGSSNIDVDISIGTIFGVMRYDKSRGPVDQSSFLVPGREYCAAGYVIYGSSTVLVLTMGKSVHGFTWDPTAGEFFLSHENIRCPSNGNMYSINEGNHCRWTPEVQKWNAYVKADDEKTRRPYKHRYVGSLVADAHRTLLKGGIFAYPPDTNNTNGKLRLLYEANPFAMILEAAGGKATDGQKPILDIAPTEIHQRVPLILGSVEDVDTYASFMRGEGPR